MLTFMWLRIFFRFETKYSNVGDKPTVHHGAWWYGSDVKSNLNGKYFESEVNSDESMFWHGFKQKKSLKTARMMIREGVSCEISNHSKLLIYSVSQKTPVIAYIYSLNPYFFT